MQSIGTRFGLTVKYTINVPKCMYHHTAIGRQVSYVMIQPMLIQEQTDLNLDGDARGERSREEGRKEGRADFRHSETVTIHVTVI